MSQAMPLMEKKEATATSPGMCEKLYNALNPSLRPLRRLTFRRPETDPTAHTTTTLSPPKHPSHTSTPAPHTSAATKASTQFNNIKAELVSLMPEKPKPTASSSPAPHTSAANKASTQFNNIKAELVSMMPEKPKHTTPVTTPATTTTHNTGLADLKNKIHVQKVRLETATAPAAPVNEMPKPQPPAAPGLKKNINDKVDDYIARAKAKIRTGSTVGKNPSG